MLTKKQINFFIIADLALIIMALCFANYSDFDVDLQNHFFNYQTQSWLIDADEPIARFIFYTFPKILFGLAIALVAILALFGFKKKSEFLFKNRHKFFLIFWGLVIIPLIVGNIKKFTDIYCPNQLDLYNGKYPHVKILEKQDENFKQLQRTKSPHGEPQYGKPNYGQCFPAGHAITGFAFMILFFALEKKSHRYFSLWAAISVGWILGLYQMLKGAHFLSHNLVSMLLCFLVAALIKKMYNRLVAKNISEENSPIIKKV